MSGIGLLVLAGTPGVLNVTATPPQSAAGGFSGPYNTPAVKAIAADGSGSYSYSWVGDGVVVENPTSQTTGLHFTGPIDTGSSAVGTATATVTDTMTGAIGAVHVPVSWIAIPPLGF